MAATEVKRPFHHPGWVFEEKVDGWRLRTVGDRRNEARRWRIPYADPQWPDAAALADSTSYDSVRPPIR